MRAKKVCPFYARAWWTVLERDTVAMESDGSDMCREERCAMWISRTYPRATRVEVISGCGLVKL